MNAPETPEEWAELLKTNWEKRASSPYCHYYISSHPRFDDPELWEQQGRMHADFILQELDSRALGGQDVLEIGCGVGRLVPHILPRVGSYTGFDIASGMVDKARSRFKDMAHARFFLSDGLSLPEEARDRQYHLAFALAVLIHCPREVIASLLKSIYSQMALGGEIRFQLLTDPVDSAGLKPCAASETTHEEIQEMQDQTPREVMELIDGHYYMGTRFLFNEIEPFLAEATGGEIKVSRFDLCHAYGQIYRR